MPSAVALTAPITAEFVVVPTVEVNEDNIIIPSVPPVAAPTGPEWAVQASDVLWEGQRYTVTLGFSAPVDFLADSSQTIFDRLAFADATDESGAEVCQKETVGALVRGLLLWRDLVQLHGWYESTYVGMQEGYAWYYNEKNLKAAYWLTQPFVLVHDLIKSATAIGDEITDWLKAQVGFGTDEEAEAGALAFERVSQLLADGLSICGGAAGLIADQAFAVEAGHHAGERQGVAIDHGVHTDRHLAASFEFA